MSTYSLTLRTDKGSKLTQQELDNNFLYVSGFGTFSINNGIIVNIIN
jgi:hypothetical protein